MSSKNFKVKEGLDVNGSITAGYTQNYLFGFGGGDIKFVGNTASAGYGSLGCAPVTNGSTIVRLGTFSPEYSVDGGSTWVAQDSLNPSAVVFSFTYGQSLAYGNGKFVFAYSDQSSFYIYTSTDGISWTLQNTTSFATSNTYNTISVCFENGYFFRTITDYNGKTLSDNVVLYYSTDAITWTMMFGGAINRTSSEYSTAPMSVTDRKEVTYLNGQYIWIPGGVNVYYCTTPETSSSSDFFGINMSSTTTGIGAIAYDSISNTYLATSFNGQGSSSLIYLIFPGSSGLYSLASSSIDYSLGTQSYTGTPLINYGGQIYLFLDGNAYVTLSSINQSPMGTTVSWSTPVTTTSSPTRVMSQSVAMQMNLVDSVLALSSAGSGGSSVSDATPTTAGVVYGVTKTTYDDNPSDYYNTGIGYNTLAANTTGYGNASLGYYALSSNTTGYYNVAIGTWAMGNSINSYYNVAVGPGALNNTESTYYNTAVGAYSLDSHYTGTYNTAIGYGAGGNLQIGSNNTFIGSNANAAGEISNAVVVGNGSVTRFMVPGLNVDWTTASVPGSRPGSNNVGLGILSLNQNANDNGSTSRSTALGFATLYAATTNSSDNTAVGYYALRNTSAGYFNTATGSYALTSNTTGWGNTAVGYLSLYSNLGGTKNIAIGQQALYSTQYGYGNVAVGNASMIANTGGYYNTAIGERALFANTTGYDNTSLGQTSMYYNNSGYRNTAIGNQALTKVTSGYYNTAIGYQSGGTTVNAITTGTNNTLLGFRATASSATVSNQITLGNSSVSSLRCQVTSISALSDIRDKTNIESIPVGLDFINDLRPVKFEWNMRDGGKIGILEGGFIAQEVLSTEEKFNAKTWLGLVSEDNPEKLELAPAKLIPILVKAVQELSAKVEDLESRLA